MIGQLAQRIGEAYVAPRRSIDRLLAQSPSLVDSAAMVLAGLAITGVLTILLEQMFGLSAQDALIKLLRQANPDAAEKLTGQLERAHAQSEATGSAGSPSLVVDLIRAFSFNLVLFFAAALAATGIGRLVGGEGGFRKVATAVGWWYLVSAFANAASFALLLHIASSGVQALSLLLIAVHLYSVYLLSVYLARAHGFKEVFVIFITLVIGSAAFLTMMSGAIFA